MENRLHFRQNPRSSGAVCDESRMYGSKREGQWGDPWLDSTFASSKTCSCCGWKNEKLTLSDRVFECLACGLEKDRDLNASENILKEALRVSSAIRTPSECQPV